MEKISMQGVIITEADGSRVFAGCVSKDREVEGFETAPIDVLYPVRGEGYWVLAQPNSIPHLNDEDLAKLEEVAVEKRAKAKLATFTDGELAVLGLKRES